MDLVKVEVDHHVALVGNVYMDDGVSFLALFSFWKLNHLLPNHPNRDNLGHNFLIQVHPIGNGHSFWLGRLDILLY